MTFSLAPETIYNMEAYKRPRGGRLVRNDDDNFEAMIQAAIIESLQMARPIPAELKQMDDVEQKLPELRQSFSGKVRYLPPPACQLATTRQRKKRDTSNIIRDQLRVKIKERPIKIGKSPEDESASKKRTLIEQNEVGFHKRIRLDSRKLAISPTIQQEITPRDSLKRKAAAELGENTKYIKISKESETRPCQRGQKLAHPCLSRPARYRMPVSATLVTVGTRPSSPSGRLKIRKTVRRPLITDSILDALDENGLIHGITYTIPSHLASPNMSPKDT